VITCSTLGRLSSRYPKHSLPSPSFSFSLIILSRVIIFEGVRLVKSKEYLIQNISQESFANNTGAVTIDDSDGFAVVDDDDALDLEDFLDFEELLELTDASTVLDGIGLFFFWL